MTKDPDMVTIDPEPAALAEILADLKAGFRREPYPDLRVR